MQARAGGWVRAAVPARLLSFSLIASVALTLASCGAPPPPSPPKPSGSNVRVPVRLVWESAMSEGLRAESIDVTIDGGTLVHLEKQRTDGTDPLDQTTFELWSDRVYDVPHVLHATVVFRGHGFGVFAYLSGYTFRVDADYTVFPKAPAFELKMIGYEKGTPTTPIEERPALRFVGRVLEGEP